MIDIPVSEISDWDTFHDVFATALGFPEFYGRNVNAWIDCLTYVDEDDGMTSFVVQPGDVLTLQFAGAGDFEERCPEQYSAIVECSAFVNWRRIESGQRPVVAISFHK